MSQSIPGRGAVDLLLAGQPGAGKSALGNLLIDYGASVLFKGATHPSELPRFQEEIISAARRFPERYLGAQTIPISDVQGASLPSLSIALGVRFTEMWGMDRERPIAEMTGPLIDADPSSARVVLVVRADQQLDTLEKSFLKQLAQSPWRDALFVVLNLRGYVGDAEALIKLKGFVEEQCAGQEIKPRGVFALSVKDGRSPIPDELYKLERRLTAELLGLFTRDHRRKVHATLQRPLEELSLRILDEIDFETPVVAELRRELAWCDGQIEKVLSRHEGVKQTVVASVSKLADKASGNLESELDSVTIGVLQNRPEELLRQFRTDTIARIEASLGPCPDAGKWPPSNFPWRARPGMGLGFTSASVLLCIAGCALALNPGLPSFLAAISVHARIIAVALGALGLTLGATAAIRRSRALGRWQRELSAAFTKALKEQFAIAQDLIDEVYCATRSLGALMPEIHERRVSIERALIALESTEKQTTELETLFESDKGHINDDTAQTGKHARRLAAALQPDTSLYNFFHENGFDLDASDLFGRVCEVEYALKPLLGLQSIQTMRSWLRPPLGKREKSIYGSLDRLRLRWDEVADRSHKLAGRILRKTAPTGGGAAAQKRNFAIRAWSKPVNGATQPPRIALPEEVLEGILSRILDEAQRHAYAGSTSGERVELVWSINQVSDWEAAVMLEVKLHGGQGFNAKGRKDFDLNRGGLASYLSNTDSGALAWCDRIVVTSVDLGTVWTRTINGRRASFQQVEQPAPTWTTRFSLIMPVLIEGGTGG